MPCMDVLGSGPAHDTLVQEVTKQEVTNNPSSCRDVTTGTDQGSHEAIDTLQQASMQVHEMAAQPEAGLIINEPPDTPEPRSSARQQLDAVSRGSSPGKCAMPTSACLSTPRSTEHTPKLITDSQSQRLPVQQLCQRWFAATKEGNMALLHSLHKQHPELLNHQSTAGLQCSALHWAAARGHADTVKQLLTWGANPCLLTSTGNSPLHSAAGAGWQDCVKLLLTTPQVLLQSDHKNEDGLSAAALAGKHGHQVVQDLLQGAAGAGEHPAPASQPASSTKQQNSGAPAATDITTPADGQLRTASGLRSGFFKARCIKAPEKPSAIAASAPAAAEEAPGTDSRKHSECPSVPATTADDSSQGSQGQSSQAAVISSTARSWLDAARQGALTTMQSLLSQHCQLLRYQGTGTSYAFTGNSALHWAAAKGHIEVVCWLLQQGADIQQVNEAGEAALHTAVGHGQVACAQVLVLQGGADVHMQDGLGQSALEVSNESEKRFARKPLQCVSDAPVSVAVQHLCSS